MLSTRRKAEILQQLEKENGRLAAADVVRFAHPTNSELHGEFEWDNRVAGHAHRLNQARLLIKQVKFRIVVSERITLQVPSYVRDLRSENPGSYQKIERVKSDLEMARATVIDAMSRITNATARARAVAWYFHSESEGGEFGDLVDKINGAAEEIIRRTSIDDQPQGEA